MTFAWPHFLWLLILPYGWLVWELRGDRRPEAASRRSILKAQATTHELALVERHAASRRIRPWLCAGLALAVVALARPQWGKLDEPVFNQSREIMIALDLSRSMLTHDVTPSRLERAKLLIQSLLDGLEGERVGLVIFAGTAFVQAPMSADYEILREFLPALGPDYLPEGGTNYGRMITAAAGAFGTANGADRYLIVLSDGGATDEDWRSQLPYLTEKGIHVIGLGVGTAQGGFIPDGSGGFMKDENGAVVLDKLDSGTLQELAAKTGGVYRDASSWIDLPAVLRSTVEAGRKGQFVDRTTARHVERFQWALAPAFGCLLLSFLWEFPVRPKPRSIQLQGPAGRSRKEAAATAGVLVLALGLMATRGWAAATEAPAPSGAVLGRMIARISSQDLPPSAQDLAELAGETVRWGQGVQNSQQPVPASPIRDALAAVEQGSALDPKAADWNALRTALTKLLEKPDQPPPPKNQPQQKQNPEQQQNQDQQQQQQQDQNQPSPKDSPSNPPKDQSGQNQDRSQNQNQPQDQKNGQSKNSPSSALGNFQPPKAPPSESGTQKVGGEPPQLPDPAQADPNLATPLQKLDQVRNQDSPAELFEMLQNQDPKPPAGPKGKDW